MGARGPQVLEKNSVYCHVDVVIAYIDQCLLFAMMVLPTTPLQANYGSST
jgi:hypothetical protein